jgi:hypothetical protein
MFPYPGSPSYSRRWGVPDDHAWERAMADYLQRHHVFSDIQETRPRSLHDLEDWLPAADASHDAPDVSTA